MTPPITLVIPTLDKSRGVATGKLAQLSAGCKTQLIVVDGPERGFTKTVNEGLRRATTGDVCILNDDITRFQHGWLATLRKGLYSRSRYGIAGPSGRSASESRGGRVGLRGLKVCQQLSFWCVLIRRQVIEEVGLLNEDYVHYCSDNDYCDRVRRRKWKIVWVKSVFLEHKHHGSGLRSKWKQQDQHRYRRIRARRKKGRK